MSDDARTSWFSIIFKSGWVQAPWQQLDFPRVIGAADDIISDAGSIWVGMRPSRRDGNMPWPTVRKLSQYESLRNYSHTPVLRSRTIACSGYFIEIKKCNEPESVSRIWSPTIRLRVHAVPLAISLLPPLLKSLFFHGFIDLYSIILL